jgi:hypothetical protein
MFKLQKYSSPYRNNAGEQRIIPFRVAFTSLLRPGANIIKLFTSVIHKFLE